MNGLSSVHEKLSWFIRHLSNGLYIFYSNLWNLSSDIWAQSSEMSDMSDDFREHCCIIIPPAQRSILDSPCPSVCPSVCRRHGFRSISQVCFGILISNFICMLMVAIGRSLLIFSDVTFKMAAWRPYWIFCFPDSNFTLALNINFKLQRHNTYVYG